MFTVKMIIIITCAFILGAIASALVGSNKKGDWE